MTALKSGPARLPLLSPSLLRVYGLRTATVFVIALMAIVTGTFMLREAATAQVIGARKGYAGDNGPAIEAWLDTPGGVAVAPSGELFIADSNNHVIRRIDAANRNISTVVGNNSLGAGFSGDFGPATAAQLNTPDGVAIAPDGDLIVADSHNHRVRRIDRETGEIITIAGSDDDGFSGDDGPATAAQLNTPSAVAAAGNGDIYIADTLNYRIRMIDHATGLIHTVAGTGVPGDSESVGDGGPAINATLNMPSDVAIGPNGDVYIADMHHQRVRRLDAKTRRIYTVAGSGRWGYSGDDGPATEATLAGPAGIAVVPEPDGTVTIFIADYYNGHVRAVGPDGIIREVSDGGRVRFAAPTRIAFAGQRGWLYVADSSRDRLVVLNMQRRGAAAHPDAGPARAGHPSSSAAGRLMAPSPIELPNASTDPILSSDRPLIPWMLSFLRPHRSRVALLAFLLISQIVLSALQPWPLKVVIDNVLNYQDHPLPEPVNGWLGALSGGNMIVTLAIVVLAGVLLQLLNEAAAAYGTKVQVDTGQRMVYELRSRLFQHLQALGLHHHITTNTGDAVYRIDVDSYAIENLVMSGIFPLATSVATLAVMFIILLRLDLTVALLSLSVVPFLYLCLRYYMNTIVARSEQVKELESNLIARLYEVFSAIRLVKSFAREPFEMQRYTSFGNEVMNARIAITWQESLFGLAVALVTILGTALVVIVGGTHVLNHRMTVGQLTVVIAYLGAVYGPLAAIAHTTGRLNGAIAGARRVRAMFALLPETVEAPDAIEATDVRGDVKFEAVSFSYPNGRAVLSDISFEAKPGEMVALVGLTGAGKTTLVSLIPRFYDATVGTRAHPSAARLPRRRPHRRIMGIVNGTTNFILDLMDRQGGTFEDALATATELGYAEADPTADIEGYDAAQKAAILARSRSTPRCRSSPCTARASPRSRSSRSGPRARPATW